MFEGTMGSDQRVSDHVVKAYHDLQKSGLEPMARLQKAVAMFTKENLAWQATVCPHEVLIHPDNRGGTMLNAFDVHQKGHQLHRIGVNPDLLHGQPMAFTMSPNAAKGLEQKQANQALVAASNGMLAPVTGQERYLSVASSHFVAWCRAVLASCNTTEGEVLSMDAILAGKGQGQDDPFRVLCLMGN